MVMLSTVDGNQIPSQTIEIGYDLAQHYADELVVLHVMPQSVFDDYHNADPGKEHGVDESWRYRNIPIRQEEHDDRRRFNLEDAKQAAKRLARRVTNETLRDWENISFVGLIGNPAKEIIQETKREEPRYLVIGGRKQSTLNEALFGSTSQRILRNVDLPVVSIYRDQ